MPRARRRRVRVHLRVEAGVAAPSRAGILDAVEPDSDLPMSFLGELRLQDAAAATSAAQTLAAAFPPGRGADALTTRGACVRIHAPEVEAPRAAFTAAVTALSELSRTAFDGYVTCALDAEGPEDELLVVLPGGRQFSPTVRVAPIIVECGLGFATPEGRAAAARAYADAAPGWDLVEAGLPESLSLRFAAAFSGTRHAFWRAAEGLVPLAEKASSGAIRVHVAHGYVPGGELAELLPGGGVRMAPLILPLLLGTDVSRWVLARPVVPHSTLFVAYSESLLEEPALLSAEAVEARGGPAAVGRLAASACSCLAGELRVGVIGDVKAVFLDGVAGAAERLLDPATMRRASQMLGAPVVLAAPVHRQVLALVADDEKGRAELSRAVMMQTQRLGDQALSSEIFVVDGGRPVSCWKASS